MRRYLVIALMLGVLAPAAAEEEPKTGVQVFDEIRDELTLLHNGKGGYIAVRANKDRDDVYVFSGDRKVMHESRKGTVNLPSAKLRAKHNPSKLLYDIGFIDPRYDFIKQPTKVRYKNEKWQLLCGRENVPLTVVGAREAKKILRKAKIKPEFHDRRALSLSRDDNGIYYFVDVLKEGGGTRLFIGRKGNLTKQRLVDEVNDSEGALLVTKKGTLRFEVFRNSKGRAYEKAVEWISGEKRKVVRDVPVVRNRWLIHAELGVYGTTMGTPCDLL
jgi:hypothetical protein